MTCPGNVSFSHFLVIPRVTVTGANAISSPITYGFPSITNFLGMMWALQRKVSSAGLSDVTFHGVGVVCHAFRLHAARFWGGSGVGMVNTFSQTRNPLNSRGQVAPIIEEGRINLNVSFVFSVNCPRWSLAPASTVKRHLSIILHTLMTLRAASGTLDQDPSISPVQREPWLLGNTPNIESEFMETRFSLLPGFSLVSRHDALIERLRHLRSTSMVEANLMDALVSFCRHEWSYNQHAGEWERTSPISDGWLVPMPVGYVGISDLSGPGDIPESRDNSVPHHFVESIYSVGEWVSPHRISSPVDIIWHADRGQSGIYRCLNSYSANRIHEDD